jgi:hypothetical protein
VKREDIRAWTVFLALLPMTAQASFGAAPCRDDFGCHFVVWGALLGPIGVPAASIVFALLHLRFCHPARSRPRQVFLGALFGLFAYEIAAAAGSFAGAAGHDVVAGLVPVLVVLAAASVFYVRSTPWNLKR